MNLNHALAVFVAGCFLNTALIADTVVLKNGDHLSGSIIKLDAESLTIESEFAGTLTIQWDAVTEIASEEPLYVILQDQQKLVGFLLTQEGKVTVKTEDAGQVNVALDKIQTIRSSAEEEAFQMEIERLRNPGLLDLWGGFLDLGYAAARGNADTTTFNLGVNAARTSERDKLSVYLTSIRATNDTAGLSQTTANATRGGIKYNLNTSERSSAFGFTDLEYDEFQRLDLRFVAGGGMTYQVLDREHTTFDISTGGAFNKEFFSTGLRRSSGEVLFGQELTHRLSGITTLEEKFTVYPNMSDWGAYRINFDISAVTRLNRWLSWQISLSDRFLSNPVSGNKQNDYLFTTGLRFTFEKEDQE